MNTKNNKLPTYIFSSFTEEMARRAFGLKLQLEPKDFLSDWLNQAKKETITAEEQKLLVWLHKKLNLFVRGWNEQELREKFIVHLIETVDFDLYALEVVSFAERQIKVIYNESIIQGKVEWMVARGLFEPQHPFFFIHPDSFRDKKEKDSSNDPVGQLLATLSAAQILNNQKPKLDLFNPKPVSFSHIPLYGIYPDASG